MKNKINLPSGRLEILCQQRGISLSSLCTNIDTGGSRVDLKTITKINRGEAVKDTTMRKLCDPLGISWLDLIDQSDADIVTQMTNIDFDRWEEKIPAEEAEIGTLMFYMKEAARQRQKIAVAALDVSQEEGVLKFERWLRDAGSIEDGSDESFSSQVLAKQINREFLGIQSELRREKLKIMIARYKFWEVSDEFYNRPERTFCSTNILAIAIVSSALSSVNFGVNRGARPPDSQYAISDETEHPDWKVHVFVDSEFLGVFDGNYIEGFGGQYNARPY